MFTKKTRVLSAVLTVCMLISMLACFVVPATAAPVNYTLFGTDEKASETGLKDVTALKDIKDVAVSAFVENGTAQEFKVTDRAGLERISEILVAYGKECETTTFYLANDIDMEWKNFAGIGKNHVNYDAGKFGESTNHNYSFKGTFDGNGFVIKNLLISMPQANSVGLFRQTYNATFRNVGIASGLIVGGTRVGSIAGGDNLNTDFYNCWSAATVISGGYSKIGGNGSGGIASKMNGTAIVKNNYFLGMVSEGTYAVGGIAGNIGTLTVEDSYVYGTVIGGHTTHSSKTATDTEGLYGEKGATYEYYAQGPSGVFVRAGGSVTKGTFGTNNYYRKQNGMYSSYEALQKAIALGATVVGAEPGTYAEGSAFTTNDGAAEKTKDDFKNLAASLNGDGLDQTGVPEGYTVKYVDTAAGYPALGYFAENATEPTVMRMAHTTDNVGGVDDLYAKSPLFKKFYDNIHKFWAGEAPMGEITVSNVEDLFALMIFGTSTADSKNLATYYGATEIKFSADIDMEDLPFFKGANGKCALDTFPMIASSWTLNIPVDGQNHVIKNFKQNAFTISVNDNINSGDYTTTGLFGFVNTSIKNLGMMNAQISVDQNAYAQTQSVRAGILTGFANGENVLIENCFATGTIAAKNAASQVQDMNNYGGLASRDWNNGNQMKNSWADIDRVWASGVVHAGTAWGSCSGKDYVLENVYYFGDKADAAVGYANADGTTYAMQESLGDLIDPYEQAYALNQTAMTSWWKGTADGPVWATEETATYKVTVTATKANDLKYVAYGNVGETVNLNTLLGVENATYNAETGSVGNVENGVYTFGKGDGVFTTDVSLVSDLDIVALREAYNKHSAFYDTKGVGAKLDQVEQKFANGDYTVQSEVDTAVNELAPLFALASTDKIPATMVDGEVALNTGAKITTVKGVDNAEYPNVGVYTVKDLESLQGKNCVDQTVYLCANLNLAGSSFASLENFDGRFDGQGHKITNYANDTMHGFFQSHDGPYIGNVVFEDCTFTKTNKGGSSLVVNGIDKPSTAFLMENITIRNCHASITGANGFGMLIGNGIGVDSTIRNILVEKSSIKGLDSARSNVGFITANLNLTQNYITKEADIAVNFENITVINNKLENVTTNAGSSYMLAAVESKTGAYNINMNKILVANNTGVNPYGALVGEFFSKVNDTAENVNNTVSVKNAVVYGNAATSLLAYRTSNTTNKQGEYVDFANVHTDAGEMSESVPASKKPVTDYVNNVNVYGTDAFASGEVAYNYNKTVGALAVTVDNKGDIVYTTNAADTIYKLTVTATADGSVFDAYGKAGDAIDLKTLLAVAELDDSSLIAADGSKGSIANNVYTFADGDGAYTTALKLVDPADYDTLAALYAAYPAFYGDAAKAKLDAIKAKLDAEEYAGQATFEADIKEAAEFFKIDKATSIVPVTMTRAETALNCGITLGAVANVYNDTSYLQLGIYSVADLEMLAHGPDNGLAFAENHYKATQTVHLMADLDLSTSSFLRIHGLNANFDGHDHTITGFNAATSGFVPYFRGKTFKNLKFVNCHTTASQDGSAFFLYGTTGATVTNVSFDNCSVTKNGKTGVAFFVGLLYEKMTAKDIVIRNCEVKGDDAKAAGFLVGGIDARSQYGHTSTIENILIDGCKLNNTTDDDALIVLQNRHGSGAITTPAGIAIENMIITDSTVTGDKKVSFVTQTEGAAFIANFENVVAVNNTAFANYDNAAGTKTNFVVADNAGEAAYTANKGANEDIFTVKSGKAAFMAEGDKAPVKVAFVDSENAEKLAYYTDTAGKLIDADAADLDDLFSCSITDGTNPVVVADILAATYDADKNFVLVDHNLSYVSDGLGKHTVTCDAGCGLNETGDCDKLHDDQLTGEQVVAPTEDTEGYTRHLCSACGNEWKGEFNGKLIVLKSNEILSTPTGETITIPVAMKNDPGVEGMVITVEYNPAYMTYEEILFATDVETIINHDAQNGILKVTVASAEDLPEFNEKLGNTDLSVLFKLVFSTPLNGATGSSDFKISVETADAVSDLDYVVQPLVTKVTVTSNSRGDFDLDGAITGLDASKMLRYLALLENDVNELNLAAGDLDGDADVDMRDVVSLLRILAAYA